MSIAVGIDLGTTNTVVAAVKDGVAFTIASPNGRRLIPSTISFHPSGNVLVGEPAVERRLIDPENTIYSVKRLIGRSWTSDEVQRARGRFPFKLKEGPKFGTIVVARSEEYTLPEISAFVLRYAKATAEAALGAPVDRAVITVPANFNDLQRAATKVAGKLAGLEVLRILNEPTAAALAYGQGAGQEGAALIFEAPPDAKKAERVAVYDLGGGTFDITLLDLSGNVFEVLATAGDTALGGDDFDSLIAEKMADELLKKHRFDARTNPQALGRLRMAAEALKRDLSVKDEATAELDDVAPGEGGKMLPFSFKMKRTELEWASLSLVDRTFDVCQQATERAGIGVAQLDRVILVGGSTRMPMVARRVEQFFRRPPVMKVNPDEVVALGAALQANALDRTGRRRTIPGVALPAPIISDESIAKGPDRVPQRTAPIPREEMDMPDLPVVTGRNSAPQIRSAPIAKIALATQPLPPPRAETDDVPTVVGDAIVPIGVGDLDAELPGPELPPPPPPAAKTEFGRPLVFDLPEEPKVRAPAPPPKQKLDSAAAAAVAGFGFGEPSAIRGLPSDSIARRPPAPKPPLLIDVTPLSLAVETVGGYCDKLIDANTPVPCDRTRIFLTASDNQTQVSVRVAQGESNKFAENTFLGECVLSGLAPGPRGTVEIAVTFEIDADGILNVRAKDQKTNNETRARMQLVGAQTEEHELEAMRARQARHAVG